MEKQAENKRGRGRPPRDGVARVPFTAWVKPETKEYLRVKKLITKVGFGVLVDELAARAIKWDAKQAEKSSPPPPQPDDFPY